MTDETDVDPSREGFELLSDETRLAVLRELAARAGEAPEDPTLGFAALRRRVGRRDSGNFSYHLSQLEGRFVEKTDDGYRIAPAGMEVVAAVVTGTYGGGEELGPTDIEDPCPACGGTLSATYADGLLTVACRNDHEFRNTLPPGAVDDRSIEAVVELLTRTTRQDLELALAAICPYCYGRLEWDVDLETDGTFPEFDSGCDRCGVRVEVPAAIPLTHHPEGVAFFRDHGVDVRRRPLWAAEFYDPVTVTTTTDPPRLRVAVELDGDELVGTFDESLTAREITR